MTSIADTGFVVAVAVATDRHHQACVAVYREQSAILLPTSTLTEVMYLITRIGGNGAAARFLRALPVSKYRLFPLVDEDVSRTAELLETYADTRVDFVDASVVAVAERLKLRQILTLDRRDFQIIRPRHIDRFELLPEPQP